MSVQCILTRYKLQCGSVGLSCILTHLDVHVALDDDADDDAGSGGDPLHHELSAINELPERCDDKDSTSAYNSGGESCRSTPLVSTERIPPLQGEEWEEGRTASPPPLLPVGRIQPLDSPLTPRHRRRERDRERRHSNLSCTFSPRTYRKYEADGNDGNAAQGSSSTPSTPSKFRWVQMF